jgi:anti-anti-sigma factor
LLLKQEGAPMSSTELTGTECDGRVVMVLRGELDVMDTARRSPAAPRGASGFTVAMLSGDLDIVGAPVLREQLLGLLGVHASQLVIDLSGVSFCDASGLAVLVGTARRVGLLGGVLRLAAPAPSVAAALRVGGLDRYFDIFPDVSAAIADSQVRWSMPVGTRQEPSDSREPAERRVRSAQSSAPDAGVLRGAVTALLAHCGAWTDADPDRRLTPALRRLAQAYADSDDVGVIEAARALLAALVRYPVTHSAAVAATAGDLRRLLDSGSLPADRVMSAPGGNGLMPVQVARSAGATVR